MEERRLFSWLNVLTSLKGIVASILVMVIGIIPSVLSYFLVRAFPNVFVALLSFLFSLLWLIFNLFLWGYLVNRWWFWE